MTAKALVKEVLELGTALGFDVAREVEASEAAWVDAAWFDPRLSPIALGLKRPRMRFDPVLPLVGFEIEMSTGLDAKHIKGSVSNLNNLGAMVGIIVIGTANLSWLRKSGKVHAAKSDEELEKTLVDRVYRWVYAESQPRGRIVIMSERQLLAWKYRTMSARLATR